MKEKYYEQMQVSINQYAQLSEIDWGVLRKLFQLRKYKKNTHIAYPGEENSNIFYICTGLIRYYYLADDGKEWNKAFIEENMLSASFSTDFLGHSSPYGIHALEDTVLLISSYSEFEALYDSHPMIERLGRKFIELVLISKMKRERSFLQNNAESRYVDFLDQYPKLVQRIAQYHLASYLGISEVSLSRICGKLA